MSILINLGSGTDILKGYVNVDIVAVPGTDVVHDLDVYPWPFDDDVAEVVRAFDVFEHVVDPLAFVAECHRVLEPGGLLYIHTSHWQTENSYTDPTHRRFCTPRTFDYWCIGTDYFRRYGPMYARGTAFAKKDVHMEGQELVFQLIKVPRTD